jgi:hypothetical protein
MFVERAKAEHERACPAYKCYEDEDTFNVTEDQPGDNRRTEKTVADYVKVLRPRILISAKDAVFEHELLAGLQDKFYRATARPTIESLIENVLVTRARTILLVDPPAELDADEVTRKTCTFTLVLRSGGAE